MYIIKREILDRDLDFISSIEYVMYINYSSASKRIEYLKLKSFTFSHALTRKELSGSNSVEEVCNGFIRLYPFIAFLRNAVS